MVMHRYSFTEIDNAIEQRLQFINAEMKGFAKVVRDDNKSKHISIIFDGKPFLLINYYISNSWSPDGKRQIIGMCTINIHNDSRWYSEEQSAPSINIDEFLRYGNGLQFSNLNEFLDKYLPIKKDEQIHEINKEFQKIGISLEDIKFNTCDNRYWLYFKLSKYINNAEPEEKPSFLCKYLSLSTYMNMLKNKTFRMNSITSMNDTSETFFLGEFLCDIYKTKEERYKETIKNHNILITSLSKPFDSALMWRLYGDNGKEVCLVFDTKSAEVNPILYIGEKNPQYQNLRTAIRNLKNKGINTFINDIEKQRFFVKSSQFDYEKEYRLMYTSDSISYTQYENLISYYKDFDINEMGYIPELKLSLFEIIIGANLPEPEVNYPLLVNLTNQTFGVDIINWSKVDKIR